MKVSPARRAAFEMLQRVEQEGAYSSALLAAADESLSSKDRRLCRELVLGILRNRLWLDRAIEHFSSRKIEKLDLAVTLALRLGLYQLRFLTRIPQSAAVNESVNLVRFSRLKSATSFANAVLRQAIREPNYDPATGIENNFERLAVETSHPQWLIERWAAQFGGERVASFARANNQPAPLAFRFTAQTFRDPNHSPEKLIEELKAAGADVIESNVAPGGWRVRQGARARENTGLVPGEPDSGMEGLQKFSEQGMIYFQDEASQLVAHCVAARAGDRVLDVCAAPGSKSTLMAALAPHSSVVAGDLYEQRTRLIQEFARQQGASNICVVQYDATSELPFPKDSFDRVLVDAPCSGTGTLRQNPEIRWRLDESDILELAARQKLIMQNAANVVRPGGRIIYSTCSVEIDENEGVISEFLKDSPQFEQVALEVPKRFLTPNGSARTWPQDDDVEGFFVTTLQRRTAN